MKKASFAPRARAELRAALLFYREQDIKVSRRFLQAVNNCVARLVENPRIWPLKEHGARRALLQRFPYSLYYQEVKEGVRIIAVVHNHRHPDVWHSGLSDDQTFRG